LSDLACKTVILKAPGCVLLPPDTRTPPPKETGPWVCAGRTLRTKPICLSMVF
jgi:hypothetical protein